MHRTQHLNIKRYEYINNNKKLTLAILAVALKA